MTDRMFALLQAINLSGLDNSRWNLQGYCPWSHYMVNPTEDDYKDMMEPHLSIIDIVTPTTSEIVAAEPFFTYVNHMYPPDERRYVGNGVYVNVWYLETILTWREYHVANEENSKASLKRGVK